MGIIFQELQTIEVKVQSTQGELQKALATEKTTAEGLEEVKQRFKECKAADVVELDKFIAVRKDVETVEKFLDQSKAHRTIIEATCQTVLNMQKQYQKVYEKLGKQLDKAEANTLDFPGS
jgi:3-methyladenine DNA glycosylase/8-oxoguanine DNA glycosylase